jgi:DNA-binding NarL/FixJ family response regulator
MSAECAPQEQDQSAFDARLSVVFADDDPVVLSTLNILLQQVFDFAGLATNADEAIAVVAAKQPDVVILDVNMPCGGARRAVSEIRRRAPGTAIVILSADEMHEDVVELLRLGAVAYLRKGIDAATLLESLLQAVEAHRHARAGTVAASV